MSARWYTDYVIEACRKDKRIKTAQGIWERVVAQVFNEMLEILSWYDAEEVPLDRLAMQVKDALGRVGEPKHKNWYLFAASDLVKAVRDGKFLGGEPVVIESVRIRNELEDSFRSSHLENLMKDADY